VRKPPALAGGRVTQALAQGQVSLKQGQESLSTRVTVVEDAQAAQTSQITTYHKDITELRDKCARLEEQNAVLRGTVEAIVPPKDTKTVMEWCRCLYGEERQAVLTIVRAHSATKYQELGYLEWQCAQVLEANGSITAEHTYPTDFGKKLFVNYHVFKQGLAGYMEEQRQRGFRPRIVQGNQKAYPLQRKRAGE